MLGRSAALSPSPFPLLLPFSLCHECSGLYSKLASPVMMTAPSTSAMNMTA